MKYIVKAPPMQTGDTQRDIQEIIRYLSELNEQLNFILVNIQRQQTANE